MAFKNKNKFGKFMVNNRVYFIPVALVFVSTAALGNGFAVNEQSVSGLGTATAGRASAAIDATTVYLKSPIFTRSHAL